MRQAQCDKHARYTKCLVDFPLTQDRAFPDHRCFALQSHQGLDSSCTATTGRLEQVFARSYDIDWYGSHSGSGIPDLSASPNEHHCYSEGGSLLPTLATTAKPLTCCQQMEEPLQSKTLRSRFARLVPEITGPSSFNITNSCNNIVGKAKEILFGTSLLQLPGPRFNMTLEPSMRLYGHSHPNSSARRSDSEDPMDRFLHLNRKLTGYVTIFMKFLVETINLVR